ncbi:MAG: protein of unknown function [Leptospirillum rubarum]|jgi:excinuclease UvrABC nuclease subunit|nr:MAG: protein of unknown function [Leptospirillum rubarum]
MPSGSYELKFDGYWRTPNISAIPGKPGIYCVYACTHNAQEKKVSIRKLLYIGESENVKDRVSGHELKEKWERQLSKGEVLCFNMAEIAPESARQRAEAAVIYHHKPPCNEEYRDSFPYDRTTITISGEKAELKSNFTVERTK